MLIDKNAIKNMNAIFFITIFCNNNMFNVMWPDIYFIRDGLFSKITENIFYVSK